jgi:hypothetical protein
MHGTRCALTSASWMTNLVSICAPKTIIVCFCAIAVLSTLAPASASAMPIKGALKSAAPTFISHEQTIRVRLSSISSTVSVTGIGLRFPGLTVKRAAVYQAIRVKWLAAGRGLNDWVVEDRDTGELLSKFKARALDISGASLRLNLKPIPGKLTLYPVSKKAADVIVSLDLESYVRGVLPAEMPNGWPLEALKRSLRAHLRSTAKIFALSSAPLTM